MEFCAHCGVNLFQNVSVGRADKRVTIQDLKYISCIAFHPYFVGIGHYSLGSKWNYIRYFGHILLCYVKGIGQNRAKMVWWALNFWGGPPEGRWTDVACSGHYYDYVTILSGNIGTEYDASYIYKDLTIQNGEVKMILDVMLWTDGGTKMQNLFGFYVFSPKKDRTSGYFHAISIFTPKPGLFDETPPM